MLYLEMVVKFSEIRKQSTNIQLKKDEQYKNKNR